MKGINVRKIAAFAGAAVLGLSAVAVADVVYGSTQLVDQNGQPTVKIYVGSKAAISDGVAAANIAAKIANEAYKSSVLTAQVSGTPKCTVGSGVGGTGTCSIVESSKKVTLEVNVPGVVAGTATFKTLITDTIDRTPKNRNNTLSEDNYTSTTTAADTSGSVVSPLRAVETGQKGVNLYRIGSGEFNAFAPYSIVDNQATSATYTEEQDAWVGSDVNAVAYDSSTSIRDVAVNKLASFVYSLKFTGNDYGIPVCTGDLASNDSTNWASCGSDSNSRTDRHRLGIRFMGENWIISEMTNPTATQASGTSVAAGGQIKIAKEAKYGIVNVGQVLDAGAFKVRLSDISVATGSTNVHPAIIDVLDANDQVVGQIQVDPGTTYTFTQSGTGNSVKIHIYKTAPGFTLNAKWAEMAIYTDEVTLKDAQRYNLVSSSHQDKNFKVSLLWKNRDWASGTDSNVSDSLRQIVIWNQDDVNAEKTKAGDVYTMLKSKPAYKLTYKGLDLTDDDYQPLTFSALSSNSYRVATTDGDVACGASSSADITYTAKMVEIKTGGDQKLGGTGDGLSGDYLFDKVLFDPIGTVSNVSTGGINGTQNQSAAVAQYAPKVFWKASNKECWNWNDFSYVGQSNPTLSTNFVKFDTAGDNSAAQGAIYFNNSGLGTTTFGNVSIGLQEDAGYYGTTSNNEVYLMVPVLTTDTSLSTFRFRSSDSATQNVYYDGLTATSFSAFEPKHVSERGTQTTSVGTSDASFKVAKKVANAVFEFAAADTEAAASANTYEMKVGDSQVFGGVTVKVKAIDATSGSCSVLGPGGQPACSVDSASLAAVIQPNNQASVEVSEPFALTSKLVGLDTDSAGAGVSILVGGPAVNTMTEAALKDTTVDLKTDGRVVKVIGDSKIVVAGWTAADTMAAADDFIAGIQRQ
ncbi:MAG: S-layer protein [Candidatus Anstonellaceae archaeon]